MPTPPANLDTNTAWDVLKELGESERHFNNLETEYRKLASIWLLAGFAGIGFVLKSDPDLSCRARSQSQESAWPRRSAFSSCAGFTSR